MKQIKKLFTPKFVEKKLNEWRDLQDKLIDENPDLLFKKKAKSTKNNIIKDIKRGMKKW